MRLYSELSFGERIAVTFLIVLVLLFALALFGYLTGGWEDAQAKDINLYQGVETDAKLLELDKRALDEAYHSHVIHLWNVWLSDGARSADRISNGLRIARASYHQAAGQIAKREQQK